MLSEFIQLNAFKSHPNLPRAVPLKIENSKFSLQLSKNTPFRQPEDSQQLIPKKIGKTLWEKTNKQNYQNEPRISSNFINASIIPKSGYFGSRESSIKSRQSQDYPINFQNANNKIPLILSPKKELSSNKSGALSTKRSPLILSSCNKFQRLNSEQRAYFQKGRSIQSQQFKNQLQRGTPLIRSMQQQILCGNQNKKTMHRLSGSKKILLKSTSQQNLSPLKQKLYKITNRSNQQNFIRENHDYVNGKRKIQRSDSFKRIIQQSRQKKKNSKDQKQNRSKDLNIEYYIGANVKRPEPAKIQSRKTLQNMDKVIKSPSKKFNCSTKGQKPSQVEAIGFQRKKIDSFVEEHVLNSNMFSLNQENSSILNMDPY